MATIRSRSDRTPTSLPSVVGDVHVVDRLGVGLELAQAVDRLGRGQAGRHGHELGRHDAAGRVLVVGHELLDFLRLVLLHQAEDLLAALVREVRHQVRRLVRIHLLEDVGRAGGLQVFEDVDLGLGFHLADGVGRGLVVEGGDHADPVVAAELVDDRRQVCRVELGQALVGDAQLHAGDRSLDRIDVLPVDVPLRNLAVETAGDGPPRPLDAEPAQQAGGSDVHGDQMQRAFDLVEPEVVDADHLAAVDVDDLAVHQVPLEADLVGPLMELADVDGGRPQRGAAGVQGSHRLPLQEYLPAVGPHDDAGHGRIPIADGDDQVGNGSDRLALLVAHGPADRLAQIEHVPPRRRVRPACGWRAPRWREPLRGQADQRADVGAPGAAGTGSGLH